MAAMSARFREEVERGMTQRSYDIFAKSWHRSPKGELDLICLSQSSLRKVTERILLTKIGYILNLIC
ncbi:MAG: hypothetical protein QOJ96_379 [Alphaproteobacteria bacterium]|jgi:hypothetical protein|nr:hypothetical protein [Alphaproteobacteria bacterium]